MGLLLHDRLLMAVHKEAEGQDEALYAARRTSNFSFRPAFTTYSTESLLLRIVPLTVTVGLLWSRFRLFRTEIAH